MEILNLHSKSPVTNCGDHFVSNMHEPMDRKIKQGVELISTARRGHSAYFKLLVKQGYSTLGLLLGTSPLVAAVRAGQETMVRVLIQSGMPVDEPLYHGRTALMLAVEAGLEGFVRILLDGEANVNLPDHAGLTPLMVSAKQGDSQVMQLLLSHPKLAIDLVDSEEKSALTHAAISGNIDITEMLLRQKANPNLPDRRGMTSLMYAARGSFLPLVDLLLTHGAEVNAADYAGCTALIHCTQRARATSESVMQRLVEAKADVNFRNKWFESGLMFASGAGALGAVDYLSARGAKLDVANMWGETPLMYAAERGHHQVVELLIRRGSHINQTDARGETALMHAVISLCSVPVEPPLQCIPKVFELCNDIYACRRDGKNAEIEQVVTILLNARADILVRNCCGQTALMLAAMHGKARLIELLLEYSELLFKNDVETLGSEQTNSFINMVCNHKWTALSYAALGGYSNVITLLLKHKSFVDNMPQEVGQAINIAVICDYPEIIHILLSRRLIKRKSLCFHLSQSVKNACKLGRVDAARLILEAFSDSNLGVHHSLRSSSFFLAVLHGQAKTARLFCKIHQRKNAIWSAFIFGHTDCLEMIHRAAPLSNGSLQPWIKVGMPECEETPSFAHSASHTNKTGSHSPRAGYFSLSSLFDAVALGDRDEVRTLLKSEANLLLRASDTGLTALLYACLHGHKDVVAELLAHGASVDKADIVGCTPLMYAARFGHTSCVQLLLRVRCNIKLHCRYSYTALSLASQMGHAEIVQILLAVGEEIPKTPKRESKALLVATSSSHTRVIEMLITKGFDVNFAGVEGRTPLIHAARFGDDQTAKLLIQKGADVNTPDPKGRTALSWAAENGKLSMVTLLLEAGCSSAKTDKTGAMPVWHAARSGYPEVVEKLLEHNVFPSCSDLIPIYRTLHPRALRSGKRVKPSSVDAVNNVCKRDGSTPLMHLCRHGFHDTVDYLCGKGAFTDIADNSGQTALHIAALYNHEQTCDVLLEMGACTDITDKQGNTPLLLALSRGHLKLVSLLEHVSTHGPSSGTEEHQIECAIRDSASNGMWISFKSRLRASFKRRTLHSRGSRAPQAGASAMTGDVSTDRANRSKVIEVTDVKELAQDFSLNTEDLATSETETCEQRENDSSILQAQALPSPSWTMPDPSQLLDQACRLTSSSSESDLELHGHGLHNSALLPGGSLIETFDQRSLFGEDSGHQRPKPRNPHVDVGRQRSSGLLSVLQQEGDVHQDPPRFRDGRDLTESLEQRHEREKLKEGHDHHQESHPHYHQQDHGNQCPSSGSSHPTMNSWQSNDGMEDRENQPQNGSVLMLNSMHNNETTSERHGDLGLDIEAVTRTTIQAAIDKCLKQLPTGFTNHLTRGATSCNATAVASVYQDISGSAAPNLTVNLNQVFHITPYVRKKKSYQAKTLKISRAKYLTTGKYGKIIMKNHKGKCKAGSKREGMAAGCASSDEDDDEETTWDGETDSDTTDVQEDSENSGDSDDCAEPV